MRTLTQSLKPLTLTGLSFLLCSCSLKTSIDLEVSARPDSPVEAFQAELVATLKAIDPRLLDSSNLGWKDGGKSLDAFTCDGGVATHRDPGCVTVYLSKKTMRATVHVGVPNPVGCFTPEQYAWAKAVSDFFLQQHQGRAKLTRDSGVCE